jgi:hypothetical protein
LYVVPRLGEVVTDGRPFPDIGMDGAWSLTARYLGNMDQPLPWSYRGQRLDLSKLITAGNDGMALFPIYLEKGITVRSFHTDFEPPGIPRLMAVSGELEKTAEPVVALSMELPRRVPPVERAIQELRDVEGALQAGLALAVPDGSLRRGPDPNEPPDLLFRNRGKEWRLETAQIHMPATKGRNEVSRWMEFSRTTDRMISAAGRLKGKLRAHSGHVVYVGFGRGQQVTASASPRRDVDDFVDFLANLHPPRIILPGGIPRQAPPNHVVRSDDGRFAVTWMPGSTGSLFERMLGFELGLMHTTQVTRAQLREEIGRVITDHDDSRNDLLVLVIGAPTVDGWTFPSASLLAKMAFEDPGLHLTVSIVARQVENILLFDHLRATTRWLRGSPPWGG